MIAHGTPREIESRASTPLKYFFGENSMDIPFFIFSLLYFGWLSLISVGVSIIIWERL